MSRVTIIRNNRTLRVDPRQAYLHTLNGGQVDLSDERGVRSLEQYTQNRVSVVPRDYKIVSRPPWHTAYAPDGQKIGTSQRRRQDAVALAANHASRGGLSYAGS